MQQQHYGSGEQHTNGGHDGDEQTGRQRRQRRATATSDGDKQDIHDDDQDED